MFYHIQLSCDIHGNGDANHGNNNCNSNYNGNRNSNDDSDGDGGGSCDYRANSDAIATDMGISLVMVEAVAATTVISMTVVVDCQKQDELRVTNTNPIENNKCNYFSCIVIYNF